MLEKLIKDIKNILDLQYVPVGVKFIPFKEDYEKLGCAELSKKRTVCGMVKHAYDGNVFKVYDQSQCHLLNENSDIMSEFFFSTSNPNFLIIT